MSKSGARTIQSTVLMSGTVFSVRRDRIVEPGGVRATRDVVVHRGSVVVLPVLSPSRLLLIRQYRHAAGRYLWEVVAGKLERSEPPLSAARRELAEETGYRARSLRKVLDVYASPGFLTERMLIFIAENLVPGPARPEEDERIETRIFTFRQVEAMICRGTLRDAKSIAAVLYYLKFLRTSTGSFQPL